jgi:glycosyltransferase involved in cell wall biosynthesis
MSTFSVFLITKNESGDIEACLDSCKGYADEVVVVDDESTDDTAVICRRRGAKVFSRKLDGFGSQKQFALEQCTGDWLLSLDADERVTPELAREIREVIEGPSGAHGYKIPRHLYFLGHRLRFGGVGRDWVLRLFKKGTGRYRPVRVHERIEVDGFVGRLRSPLHHFSYANLDEYRQKRDRYTTLAAQDLFAGGRRGSWRDRLRPAWELFARVVLKGAWLDGRPGLIYAWLSAQSTSIRSKKLLQLEKKMNE